MKYYKNSRNEVLGFESDGTQDQWIDPDLILMTQEEVDRHINPEKYLNDEEKEILRLRRMPKLTKRQFNLTLDDFNLYDQAMSLLEADRRTKIEFDSVSDIERLSPTLISIAQALNLTVEQIDEMWRYAINL
ncbi:hypothetical protein [Acinetobacter lactucae]|uniref:hypothetical protein n=1 Tax=Acinetobacter lactucae TaxID=1785128 RepID=UPI00070786E1|nr:hypothetical protein [Acinetobacter lactucae]KQE95515.1 hypothetical protein APB94_01840 [Acinetobacter lactucae]